MPIRAPHKHPKLRSRLARCWWLFPALLVAALALAVSAAASELALPPAPSQWLTDSVRLLPVEATQELNRRLAAYENQTGHQVFVWIGASTGGIPAQDFAVKTFKSWEVGQKQLNDGLLMLVFAQDRKIAIEVGYGLEDRVPDALAARIINDVMVPKLRAGDAQGALSNGIDATLKAIEGKAFVADPNAKPPVPEGSRKLGPVQLVLLGLLLLGFLALAVTHPTLALSLLWVLSSGRGGRGGFGGGGFGGGGGGRSGGGGASGSW